MGIFVVSQDTIVPTLNAFVARSGICSRRKAVDLIQAGMITVDGEVIKDPAHRLQAESKVMYKNAILAPEKKLYILLNKPVGYISTASDPENRPHVVSLVKTPQQTRIYPIGRLDQDTTGLILLTNDGYFAQKLAHPQFNVNKTYHATLDRPLADEDFTKLQKGVLLKDGFFKPDALYALSKDRCTLGIKLHSGKNRIIRRFFQSQGYYVIKLDRMVYANLEKKGLKKGSWRFLNRYEIRELQSI